MFLGKAAAECVSEDALVHLKSYKYSSVDKSLISHYILRHYVRRAHLPIRLMSFQLSRTVECFCGTAAAMARPKHGHSLRILFHPDQCYMSGNLDTRSGRTGKQQSPNQLSVGGLCTWIAKQTPGSVVVVL